MSLFTLPCRAHVLVKGHSDISSGIHSAGNRNSSSSNCNRKKKEIMRKGIHAKYSAHKCQVEQSPALPSTGFHNRHLQHCSHAASLNVIYLFWYFPSTVLIDVSVSVCAGSLLCVEVVRSGSHMRTALSPQYS